MACSGAVGATHDHAIQAEFTTTWETAYGPELQVLLRNTSKARVEFGLDLKKKLECKPYTPAVGGWLDTTVNGRTDSIFLIGPNIGSIEPGGWTHRTLAAWWTSVDRKQPLPGKCRAVVWFEDQVNRDVWEQIVELDIDGMMNWPEESVSQKKVDAEKLTMSAVYETAGPPYEGVIRVVVWNPGTRAVDVATLSRQIDCQKPGEGWWSMSFGPVDGLSNGPVQVRAGSWGAYVHGVEFQRDSQGAGCVAHFTMGYRNEDHVYEAFRRVDVPIVPAGYYSRYIME